MNIDELKKIMTTLWILVFLLNALDRHISNPQIVESAGNLFQSHPHLVQFLPDLKGPNKSLLLMPSPHSLSSEYRFERNRG